MAQICPILYELDKIYERKTRESLFIDGHKSNLDDLEELIEWAQQPVCLLCTLHVTFLFDFQWIL